MQLTGAAAGALVESPSLKVVSSERTIGSRRTIFEVAPNRRVTLNEIEIMQLNAVVTAGAASTQSRVTTRDSAQPAPFAPTTKRGIASGQASAPSRPAAPPTAVVIPRDALAESVASSTAVSVTNTIRWTDPVTRKLMELSGPFTIEELQLLRARIERQRADSLLKD